MEFSKHFPSNPSSPGWLGVTISKLDDNTSEAIGLNSPGALVTEIADGSPAQIFGIQKGDIIYSANDQPVDDAVSLTRQVLNLESGDRLQLKILRSDEHLDLTVILSNRPN